MRLEVLLKTWQRLPAPANGKPSRRRTANWQTPSGRVSASSSGNAVSQLPAPARSPRGHRQSSLSLTKGSARFPPCAQYFADRILLGTFLVRQLCP